MDATTATKCLKIINDDSPWAGDWKTLALAFRETLEAGLYLPKPIWEALHSRQTPGGKRLSHVWNALRRDHLNVCWPHLAARRTLGELAAVTNREWSAEALHERLVDHIASKIEESGGIESPNAQRLIGYIEKLASVPSREFRAETFELWQLIEWSEPGHTGNLPEGEFLSMALRAAGASDDEEIDTWRSARGRVFKSLPKRADRYDRFPIRKGSGEPRWIEEPCAPLKRIQRRIADILKNYRSAHPSATGFVEGRSTALHARYHAGAEAAVTVDIRDFFSSITKAQVASALRGGPHLSPHQRRWANPFANWVPKGIFALADLVCVPFKNVLPQGAPSSPPIANLVAAELDRRVRDLIRERLPKPRFWSYSRYADDLVLSTRRSCSDTTLQKAYLVLLDAIREMGWRQAPEKTKRWHRWEGGPLTICGIEVPATRKGRLSLPRSVRRRIRSALHHYRTDEDTPEDRGLLAYAYTVTGDHGYRVLSSKETAENLRDFALGLAPNDETADRVVETWAFE